MQHRRSFPILAALAALALASPVDVAASDPDPEVTMAHSTTTARTIVLNTLRNVASGALAADQAARQLRAHGDYCEAHDDQLTADVAYGCAGELEGGTLPERVAFPRMPVFESDGILLPRDIFDSPEAFDLARENHLTLPEILESDVVGSGADGGYLVDDVDEITEQRDARRAAEADHQEHQEDADAAGSDVTTTGTEADPS